MNTFDIALAATSSLEMSTPTYSRRHSLHIPRKTSWGAPISPPSNLMIAPSSSKNNILNDVELHAKAGDSTNSQIGISWNTVDKITSLGLSFNEDNFSPREVSKTERFSLDDVEIFTAHPIPAPLEPERPFNKWLKNIERRAGNGHKTVSGDTTGNHSENMLFELSGSQRKNGHKKSSSASSMGFVTAMKSASISLASFSIATKSKRTGVSSRQQRTDRSTTASNVGRASEDSSYIARGIIIDQAVTTRLLQRRRVIEELINTEESYVADVKFLMNTNCIESPLKTPPNGHHRWRSLDAVPERSSGPAWLQKIPGMTAEPQIAAEVAKVFGKKMNRFFVYEEYGAKYEMMMKDVTLTTRTIPQWDVYQRGLEALASSLSSINNQHGNTKKAMTTNDLLVKPIQRVCRYPLLFSELLKATPVYDCPNSHMEIENVLMRLREATTEINRATDDPRAKSLIEKAWLLQDRLVFPDMSGPRSKCSIRALGHIHLCGVLHVSWETVSGVDGQYLICLLYRDFLLLAAAPKADQVYYIQACIGLSDLSIEEVDNGKGLQCHTAPFSWKLIFECDNHLFEVTMTACSPKEELEWRARLADRSRKDGLNSSEQGLFTSLSLAIKPLGMVFGKPGTTTRRISLNRATTTGGMSGLSQVIIKNTNAFKETPSFAAINRSQSLLTTKRIPVLAPTRAERSRLENLLIDVWTKDVLPYPGMPGRGRGEHLVRASASSMMRKLSVASIASNFTKRSGSMASLQKTSEDTAGSTESESKGTPMREFNSMDVTKSPGVGESIRSRLSVIQDEKENLPHIQSFESLAAHAFGLSDSPTHTTQTLAALRGKKSWGIEGQRIITPPLRTSSAYGVTQSRLAILSVESAIEEKEQAPQVHAVPMRKQKDKEGKRAKVGKGIRSFFR